MWKISGRNRETRALLEQQSTQIEALEKAVDGFESRTKLLRMEWEDVFDRMNRVMGRLNARIRKSEAVSSSENDAEDPQKGVAPSPPVATGTHGILQDVRRRRGLLPG